MHKIKLYLLLIGFVLIHIQASGQGDKTIQQNPDEKSLAVLLDISGNGHNITNLNVYLVKEFAGLVNVTNDEKSVLTDDIIRIKAFDKKGKMVFDGWFDNPLVEIKESFESDGTARNTLINNTSGSINVRFPFKESPDNITLSCFQIRQGQNEKLIKTITLNQK